MYIYIIIYTYVSNQQKISNHWTTNAGWKLKIHQNKSIYIYITTYSSIVKRSNSDPTKAQPVSEALIKHGHLTSRPKKTMWCVHKHPENVQTLWMLVYDTLSKYRCVILFCHHKPNNQPSSKRTQLIIRNPIRCWTDGLWHITWHNKKCEWPRLEIKPWEYSISMGFSLTKTNHFGVPPI